MKDRIVLRNVATPLSQEEILLVSGGEDYSPPEDGNGGGPFEGTGSSGLTGGQSTQKVSSEDPNGPLDTDTSTVDF